MEMKTKGQKRGGGVEGMEGKGGVGRKGGSGMGGERVASWLLGGMDAPGGKYGLKPKLSVTLCFGLTSV